MKLTLHLADDLDSADIEEPAPNHVECQYIEVGGDERLALFQHPTSSVRFRLPASFAGGVLRTACGIATNAWPSRRGPVVFRVGVVDDSSTVRWLHDSNLDPRREASHRRWRPIEVSVPLATHLVLETSARRTAHAAAGWDDPVLEWASPASERPARTRRSQPNVLLITADAVRPSATSPPRPTTAVLAADGLRCREARLVATAPPPSDASVFTGRYPVRLGMVSEWQALPTTVPNLATELARAGYHTAFASSQQQLARPEMKFAGAFAEVLPCLTNPVQPGHVTTRRALRWLESVGDDRPWFLWVTYLDTHPPYRLPDDLAARFYEGDPRDPSRTYRLDELENHTMESMLALNPNRTELREGIISDGFVRRLRDTANALDGTLESGPDLAIHLRRLGARARHGLGVPEFAAWLHDRVRALEKGVIELELLHWLDDELLPVLSDLERESLAWQEGVVDYRYMVAQAEAGALHVDNQVDELLAYLKGVGLYDDCTVVFCSPHVELVADQGHRAHHQSIAAGNVQVPLVFKPARSAGVTVPAEVDGPIELIDVMPTLLDSLGLPIPQVDGMSHWPALAAGHSLADRDTFITGYDATQVSITRGAHTLTKTLASHGDGAPVGSVVLYERSAHGDVPLDDAALEKELSANLDRWLLSTR